VTLSATVDTFDSSDGLKLLRRSWTPPAPSRALAIVHGFAEHSERYDRTARDFAERGFAVQAFDRRGHGESEGPRNFTPSFDALLDDIELFIAGAKQATPDLPFVLVGHSMGGLEVAALLALRAPTLDAAVLSGPALGLGPGVSSTKALLSRVAARVAPRMSLDSGLPPDAISRDPAVVAAYTADPRISTRMSFGLGGAMMGAIARVPARASDVRVPVLIVHGEADELCPIDASRRFHAALQPAGCELKSYPGLRHEVFNEPEREQVIADVAAWLDKIVPS